MATTPEGYITYDLTHEQQVGRAQGIAGFVLGILSILFFVVPLIGLSCGIVGVVLSSRGRSRYTPARGNFAGAGMVLSIIGIVFGAMATLAWIAAALGMSLGWTSGALGY